MTDLVSGSKSVRTILTEPAIVSVLLRFVLIGPTFASQFVLPGPELLSLFC